MRPARLLTVVAALAGLALGSCADPYERDGPHRGRPVDRPTTERTVPHSGPSSLDAPNKPQLPDPPATGELPGQLPLGLSDEPATFPGAEETPGQTLALAARLYGNWTSASVPRRFRAIAALSIGQARAELRQAAAQSGTDAQQQAVRSRASVETIEISGSGDRRDALVVTRQQVVGPDLPAIGWRYQVTLAALERRGVKWVISRWAPQP